MLQPQLRLRISEDLEANERRVEVLDPDDNVLGDLAGSVADVTWKMGTGNQSKLGIVQIDVACERALVESIEVRGQNKR